jgi:proteic killer suppression protein
MDREIIQERLLLALYGLGSNAGIKRMSAGQQRTNYKDLLYVRRRYITKDQLRAAIREVVNATLRVRSPEIWGRARQPALRTRRSSAPAAYSKNFAHRKMTLDVSRLFCHTLDMDEQAPPESQPKYRDRRTARFAAGERVREFQAFKEQAERRLDLLEAATRREDLMLLLSNRFEALGGDRKGQFSIRINQQWRVCFEWPDDVDRPFHIEITDYHS